MAASRPWNAARRLPTGTCGDQVPLMKRTAPGPVPNARAASSSATTTPAGTTCEIAVRIHAQEGLVPFSFEQVARPLAVAGGDDPQITLSAPLSRFSRRALPAVLRARRSVSMSA